MRETQKSNAPAKIADITKQNENVVKKVKVNKK